VDPEGVDGSSTDHARCRPRDHRAAQRQEVEPTLSSSGSAFRRRPVASADIEHPVRRATLKLKHEALAGNAVLFADDIVDVARRVSGVELDYSVASLTAVDSLIAGFRAQGVTEERFAETLFGFGCYVGEVMVRHAGGSWTTSIGTPLEAYASFPLLVSLPPDNLSNPIGKVFKAFRNGDTDSVADFYRAMTAG
jgi:hypothetical protein